MCPDLEMEMIVRSFPCARASTGASPIVFEIRQGNGKNAGIHEQHEKTYLSRRCSSSLEGIIYRSSSRSSFIYKLLLLIIKDIYIYTYIILYTYYTYTILKLLLLLGLLLPPRIRNRQLDFGRRVRIFFQT